MNIEEIKYQFASAGNNITDKRIKEIQSEMDQFNKCFGRPALGWSDILKICGHDHVTRKYYER